jgi:hypothetical protein
MDKQGGLVGLAAGILSAGGRQTWAEENRSDLITVTTRRKIVTQSEVTATFSVHALSPTRVSSRWPAGSVICPVIAK